MADGRCPECTGPTAATVVIRRWVLASGDGQALIWSLASLASLAGVEREKRLTGGEEWSHRKAGTTTKCRSISQWAVLLGNKKLADAAMRGRGREVRSVLLGLCKLGFRNGPWKS